VTRVMPLLGMVGRPEANTWCSRKAHKISQSHSRDISESEGVQF